MNNNEQIRRLTTEIELLENEVKQLEKQIRKVRGGIAWQNNRSQQASTICKRGF